MTFTTKFLLRNRMSRWQLRENETWEEYEARMAEMRETEEKTMKELGIEVINKAD